MGIMRLMSTPRSVFIEITHACNLRCRYCSFFTTAAETGGDLPKEEWLDFFEELGRCAVLTVTLSGGEPFCRGDLAQILQGIVRNRMRFYIITNGTQIRDEIASYIASTKRCDGVQVSLDGSTPATNDPFRGEGSFTQAVQGIRILKKNGIPVSARVTVHKKNLLDLENVAGLLLDDLGLSHFSTNSTSYLGRCRFAAGDLQLDVQERSLAMQTLFQMKRRYPGRVTGSAGPLADVELWLAMERARNGGTAGVPGGGYLSSCAMPSFQIAVRADGMLVPCNQLPDMTLGRINRDALGEIWRSHPDLQRLRKRRDIPLRRFSSCAACRYNRYCTGSCPAIALNSAGDAYSPSDEACLSRFLASGGTLPGDNG
jgi:SynChlorMet cassette radical SAM/SPASM protein ScmE